MIYKYESAKSIDQKTCSLFFMLLFTFEIYMHSKRQVCGKLLALKLIFEFQVVFKLKLWIHINLPFTIRVVIRYMKLCTTL